MSTSLTKALPYLAFAIVVLGALNFLWFMAEIVPLNLLPEKAQVVGEHHYLWSKTLAGYVEFDPGTWSWLRFHHTLMFASWPLVMLAMASVVFTYHARGIDRPLSAAETAARVRQVRASGHVVASGQSGGVIGTVWFSRSLLRVEVYPGGIVLKPRFLPERAVLVSEIRAVGFGALEPSPESRPMVMGFGVTTVASGRRPAGLEARIDHSGVGTPSPLMIVGPGSSTLANAVVDIAAAIGAGDSIDAWQTRDRAAAESPTQTWPPDMEERLGPGIKLGFEVLGIVVGAAMVVGGIAFAIPQLGPFGLVWTAAGVAILIGDVRKYMRRQR